MDPKTQKITQYEYITYHEMMNELSTSGSISKDNEKCSICQDDYSVSNRNIVKLSYCNGHYFHDACIHNCRQGKEFIKCPNCGYVYGIQTGQMPSGKMTVRKVRGAVPGFNCQSYIQIDYIVSGATINNINYPGTNRTAFLPDTTEGNYALTLLTIAFQRGLTFIPGKSITTGANGILWAIHHKTLISGANYGYPDPSYLQRLSEELKSRGVTF